MKRPIIMRKTIKRATIKRAVVYSTLSGHGEKQLANSVKGRIYKKKLALLLPGHNEELIIQSTIRSAVAAGQNINDIFVVDDDSNDSTREKVLELLKPNQILTVERSGKAEAVYQAIKFFNIEERYTWLHIADADSVFSPEYFRRYKRKLDPKKYAVAVGFVQSLRGNWISKYRSFSYTYSQHVLRRIQSYFGMISVFPGPITCFRTDIIKDIDFVSGTITEDFDITLQVHRKHLGRIVFIPEAVNYTQDPQTLRDFIRQNARWQRGFFQCVLKYKIGRRPQMIDLSLGYQMFEMLVFLLQVFVIIPYLAITTGRWEIIPIIVGADFAVITALAIASAFVVKRISILYSLPYFYFLRWLELGVFITAFVEVVILRKFRGNVVGWETKGRRYALDSNALQDTAQAE